MGKIIIVATMDMDNGMYSATGKPLYKLPKNIKHFKEIIKGKKVLFDKDTYKKLDFNIPAKDIFVYNFGEDYKNKKVTTLNSIVDILELAKEDDLYIYGGEELYLMLLSFADKMMLTFVHNINKEATEYFPDFNYKEWKFISKEKIEPDKKNKESFTFSVYNRR